MAALITAISSWLQSAACGRLGVCGCSDIVTTRSHATTHHYAIVVYDISSGHPSELLRPASHYYLHSLICVAVVVI